MPQLPIIREATALDAVNILKLLRREGRLPKRSEWTDFDYVVHIVEVLRASIGLVAEQSGRIIATIAVTIPEVRERGWFLNGEWVYVLPPYRSRGTLDELLRKAEEIAKDHGVIVKIKKDLCCLDDLAETRLRSYRVEGEYYVSHAHAIEAC